MSEQHQPIPPGRLKAYRVFLLVERLVAAALFAFVLTKTNQSTDGLIWGLLITGAVAFAGLAAYSAYELAAKPGKL